MVNDPADYSWSSYPCNALGKGSWLRKAHSIYLALGASEDERQVRYRALFRAHVDGVLLDKIRKSINSGLAIGNEMFAEQIEALTGRRVTSRKRGRPKRPVEEN
jgi:putative transposase